MSLSYKESGVDVEAGEKLVDWLRQDQGSAQSIHKDKLIEGIGGFASLYRAQFPEMKSPALVSCTDGVGTKVLIAAEYSRFEGVGQDLVAMCVNDLICTGGMPLFFLDYYACGKLNLDSARQFLTGVRKACEDSFCLLLGGETAEMPGVYLKNHFDCAGFAVGVVDEDKRLGAHRVSPGDRIMGVESHGFHSNGYSLLRQVFADDMSEHVDQLLRPTALYVALAKSLQNNVKNLKAMAHITGGGLDNISRILPDGTKAELKKWPVPDLFLEVKTRANLSWSELLKTLNCGVGLALVLPPEEWEVAAQTVKESGFNFYDLGSVDKGPAGPPSWSLDGLCG